MGMLDEADKNEELCVEQLKIHAYVGIFVGG